MTVIEVKQPRTDAMVFESIDGELKCAHVNIEVEPPCCSGVDSDGHMSCGCGGVHSFWCPDCKNEQLTEDQMQDILEAYYDRSN